MWTALIIFSVFIQLHASVLSVGSTDSTLLGTAGLEIYDTLFEGDLKLTKEIILKFYNFSSIPGGEELKNRYTGNFDDHNSRTERAAGSESIIKLWTNNEVFYKIASNFSAGTKSLIRRAINHWEEETCLQFVPAQRETSDYIYFTNYDSGCYSNSIARKGGMQIINLQRIYCETFGVIVHEIGHAIGFWHEQSRPDRDSYVTINFDNIKSDRRNQFMKRKDIHIDYQGSDYDYGSIMHYPSNAFLNCAENNCKSIEIANAAEYNCQGRPTLGQRNRLSARDIRQANRLYKCAGQGIRGPLVIQVKSGQNLENSFQVNPTKSFVKIIAVDSDGVSHTEQTPYKTNTENPVWNVQITMANKKWQFFRISVWNYNAYFSQQISMSQTVIVTEGQHQNLKHCQDSRCAGYVMFDYYVGSTISLPTNSFKLQIKIVSAHNLSNTDLVFNYPDPYVQITAGTSCLAIVQTKSTRTISGTVNPSWNQWLNFSCQSWNSFDIQILDSDYNSDDAISDKETVLVQPGFHKGRHLAHGEGYLTYDYNLVRDGNDCISNPCLNGGSCIDRCFGYSCSCRHNYAGSNCETFTCSLQITARYGRNLPDEDGWWNDSDPYMEFIAIDKNGNSVTRTTSYKQGNHNPNWDESINFGASTWKEFKVRVYDSDLFYDDPLSSQQTFSLSNAHSQTGVIHRCNRGYTVFDYSCN